MGSVVKLRRPGRPKVVGLRARRRAEIVKHAIAEFARSGYADADLDAIAAHAGCSKGTLYNYFASKGELFNASVDHVMFSMVEAAGINDQGDTLDQLEKLVEVFLRHFAEHPQYVELLIQERSDFRDRKKPTYFQYRAASRQWWRARFKQLMQQGRMRQMPTEQAIDSIGNLLYGTVFLNYFRRRQIKPRKQSAQVLDVLLGGLLPEREFLSRKR
jgi:AcrR family transcriptional regulator